MSREACEIDQKDTDRGLKNSEELTFAGMVRRYEDKDLLPVSCSKSSGSAFLIDQKLKNDLENLRTRTSKSAIKGLIALFGGFLSVFLVIILDSAKIISHHFGEILMPILFIGLISLSICFISFSLWSFFNSYKNYREKLVPALFSNVFSSIVSNRFAASEINKLPEMPKKRQRLLKPAGEDDASWLNECGWKMTGQYRGVSFVYREMNVVMEGASTRPDGIIIEIPWERQIEHKVRYQFIPHDNECEVSAVHRMICEKDVSPEMENAYFEKIETNSLKLALNSLSYALDDYKWRLILSKNGLKLYIDRADMVFNYSSLYSAKQDSYISGLEDRCKELILILDALVSICD